MREGMRPRPPLSDRFDAAQLALPKSTESAKNATGKSDSKSFRLREAQVVREAGLQKPRILPKSPVATKQRS